MEEVQALNDLAAPGFEYPLKVLEYKYIISYPPLLIHNKKYRHFLIRSNSAKPRLTTLFVLLYVSQLDKMLCKAGFFSLHNVVKGSVAMLKSSWNVRTFGIVVYDFYELCLCG